MRAAGVAMPRVQCSAGPARARGSRRVAGTGHRSSPHRRRPPLSLSPASQPIDGPGNGSNVGIGCQQSASRAFNTGRRPACHCQGRSLLALRPCIGLGEASSSSVASASASYRTHSLTPNDHARKHGGTGALSSSCYLQQLRLIALAAAIDEHSSKKGWVRKQSRRPASEHGCGRDGEGCVE